MCLRILFIKFSLFKVWEIICVMLVSRQWECNKSQNDFRLSSSWLRTIGGSYQKIYLRVFYGPNFAWSYFWELSHDHFMQVGTTFHWWALYSMTFELRSDHKIHVCSENSLTNMNVLIICMQTKYEYEIINPMSYFLLIGLFNDDTIQNLHHRMCQNVP